MLNPNDEYLYKLLGQNGFNMRFLPICVCSDEFKLVGKGYFTRIHSVPRVLSSVLNELSGADPNLMHRGELDASGSFSKSFDQSVPVLKYKTVISGIQCYAIIMPMQNFSMNQMTEYTLFHSAGRNSAEISAAIEFYLTKQIEHTSDTKKLCKNIYKEYKLIDLMRLNKNNAITIDDNVEVSELLKRLCYNFKKHLKVYGVIVDIKAYTSSGLMYLVSVNAEALSVYFESLIFSLIYISSDRKIKINIEDDTNSRIKVEFSTYCNINDDFRNITAGSLGYVTLEKLAVELLIRDNPFALDLMIAQDFVDKNGFYANFSLINGIATFTTQFKVDKERTGVLLMRNTSDMAFEVLLYSFLDTLFTKDEIDSARKNMK